MQSDLHLLHAKQHNVFEWVCVFVCVLVLNQSTASQFLSRHRRANSLFEESKKGDLERECIEELCNKEEAREIFENHPETVRKSRGALISLVGLDPDPWMTVQTGEEVKLCQRWWIAQWKWKKIAKMTWHKFPELKLTSSDVWFCLSSSSKSKYIPFTVIKDSKTKQIFSFCWHFCYRFSTI